MTGAVNAGLCGPRDASNPAGIDYGFGIPSGKFGFSGGACRQNGAFILLHGNGGAVAPAFPTNGWAGNDVDGMSLAAETPVWETIVPPTSAFRYWFRGAVRSGSPELGEQGLPMDPGNPTQIWRAIRYLPGADMADVNGSRVTVPKRSNAPMPAVRRYVGATIAQPTGDPNMGHTYQCTVFIDQRDTFIRFGCGNLQELDEGRSQFLDGWTWARRAWVRKMFGVVLYGDPNTDAGIQAPNYSGFFDSDWRAKDDASGDVYYPISYQGNIRLVRWRQSDGTQQDLGVDDYYYRNSVYWHQGVAAIHPTLKLLLWRGALSASTFGFREYDVRGNVHSITHGTPGCALTGPHAAAVIESSWYGPTLNETPLIWSQILGKFLFFRGDGQIYSLERTGTATYFCDRLTIFDASPGYTTPGGMRVRPIHQAGTSPQVYNRFWEFPSYGIVATLLNNADAVWVVRLR